MKWLVGVAYHFSVATENKKEMRPPEKALRAICEILAQHHIRVEGIILFGSRARGEARPDSDWDLCVLIDRDLRFDQRRQLLTEIKRELARLRVPNDIVLKSRKQFHRTKTCPGHLSYEIAREGVPIS